MGLNLHLIDQRSPRGFTFISTCVPARMRSNYPILRMQRPGIPPGHPMYAMMSLVGPSDTMDAVLTTILSQYRPNSLDVIRVECHGVAPYPGANVDTIEFGAIMNASTVSAFTRIRPLWSRPFAAVTPGTVYNTVVPRIEMHGCEPVPGCNATLQALATAAQACVFASSASQDVNTSGRWQDMFAIEPPVFQFNPGGSQPIRLP